MDNMLYKDRSFLKSALFFSILMPNHQQWNIWDVLLKCPTLHLEKEKN